MGQPAPPPPATVDHDAALTVLVAEDSAAVREMVARALRAGGHRVIVAEGGQAALLEAGRHAGGIDLLLTDVVLPGMSGRELAASLRERYPQLPVLYMSGYTDNTIVHHGVLDARVQFLAKPFTPPQLLDAVRRAVRQPGVATPP